MALSLGDFNDTVGGECPQSGRTGHSGSQEPFVPLCWDRSYATWSPPFLLFSLDTCRPRVRHRLLPGGLPWWFIWLKKGKTFWTVKEELQHSNHGSPKEYNILQVPTQCSSLYLLIFSSFREKALSRSGRRSISHWRWGGFGKVWKHFRLSQCGLGLLLSSTELRQGWANHPTMYKMAPTSKDYLASNENSAKVDRCSFSSQFGTTASRKAFLSTPDRVRYLFLVSRSS